MPPPPRITFGRLLAASLALTGFAHANDWVNWRGPLQNGVSLEHYKNVGKISETPAWTYDARGRGTAVVFEGKVILWGYKGTTGDLVELLTCLDAKTGRNFGNMSLPISSAIRSIIATPSAHPPSILRPSASTS